MFVRIGRNGRYVTTDGAHRLLRAIIASGAVLVHGAAVAQLAPVPTINSSELLRQQERERELREREEQQPDVRLQGPQARDTERLQEAETPCFPIDRILLQGNLSEQFQWALTSANVAGNGEADPAIGRCLGARGINLVMKRIQNAIVARGFITTRVLAPPQDLRDGTLSLTLVPGRVRQVRVEEQPPGRATIWNAVPIDEGDLLSLRDVEQALENLKRVPSVEADFQVLPTEAADAQPGESDLLIKRTEGRPYRLTLSLDDAGTKTTGKYQGGLTLSLDNPLRLNDVFYLSANSNVGGTKPAGGKSRAYVTHYSVPYGYWQLALNASANTYDQSIAGASQTYRYSGESENTDIQVSRLLYRDAARKSTLSARLWQRASRNFIDDTEVEVQRRRMAGWDVGLSHREYVGSGTLDLNANYRRGTGALDSIPAPEESFGEGTAKPRIITASAVFNQPFGIGAQHWRYNLQWRAQWPRTSLVPQDRFSIGGRYTVRGFDGNNTLLAERGWLVRNDIGWSWLASPEAGGHELYAGVDHGQVSGQSAAYLVGTSLTGAVLGLRGSYLGITYDAFTGWPLAKPDGFRTADQVYGFNLNWTY